METALSLASLLKGRRREVREDVGGFIRCDDTACHGRMSDRGPKRQIVILRRADGQLTADENVMD